MGSLTTNKFFYKPAYLEYGETNLDSFDAAIDALDARLANEVWVGDPIFEDPAGSTPIQKLQNAVSQISTATRLLIPPGTYSISADYSTGSSAIICPVPGAIFAIASGKKLTIPKFECGEYRVFNDGNAALDGVILSSCYKPNPVWWWDGASDFSPCVRAAVKCNGAALIDGAGYYCYTDTVMPSGTFADLSSLNLTNCYGYTLRGADMRGTILEFATTGAAVDTVGGLFFKLSDFTIKGNSGTKPTVGLLGGRSKDGSGHHVLNSNGMVVDRLNIEGSFQYGGVYLVNVELERFTRYRIYLTTSGFGVRHSPTNALSLTSAVTINTDAPYRDSQTAHTYENFYMGGYPGTNFVPFQIDGPYGGGYESGHGFSGVLSVLNGYVYVSRATALTDGEVFKVYDGAGEIFAKNLSVEGAPETIFRVLSSNGDACNNYGLVGENIHALGVPFAIISDSHCDIYDLRFSNLFIGSLGVWGSAAINTSNILIGGNLYRSKIESWFGYYTIGTITITGNSRGNFISLDSHTISIGSDNGTIFQILSATNIGQGLTGPIGSISDRGDKCVFGSVIADSYELIGTTVTGPSIPANSILLGIVTRIDEAITGSSGYSLGVSGDTTRFIDSAKVNITLSDIYGMGIDDSPFYASSTPVLITRKASDFTNGTLYVALHVLQLSIPTH